MTTNKQYQCYKMRQGELTAEEWQKIQAICGNNLLFIYENNRQALEVNVQVEGLINPNYTTSLYELVVNYKQQLIAADIYSVRYLPEGISVLRGARYFSTYEGNPFLKVRESENRYFYSSDTVTAEDNPERHALIDEAFTRYATLIKPAKFLLSLGATNEQAEQFSHAYLNVFKVRPTDVYSYVEYQSNEFMEQYRNTPEPNGSPIFSCMYENSRNPRLSWYGLQGDRVTLATAQKDGKIYARAIIWQDGEMIDRDGEVIYSGKIADRLYHYNHAGRAALITYLEAAGIPYKRTETWGDGVFQLPDGRTFDTSGQTIRAKIKTAKNTGGLYPFVDTLPIVTAKYASNRVQEGQKIGRAHV